jgi:beta-galactosidase/beta-glucuronidase
VRGNWTNLNGTWNFSFDDNNIGETEQWFQNFPRVMQIQVPFTYETKLSGICEEKRHDHIWYHREFDIDESQLEKKRCHLHFEGSDFLTKLWVNGQYVGSHQGGYARFSFDITDLLHQGKNNLVVKVEDSYDSGQPRGKQRWVEDSFACWYIQTTGIWKTVWCEYVPETYLKNVKMTPNLEKSTLEIEYRIQLPKVFKSQNFEIETEVSFSEIPISKTSKTINKSQMVESINVFLDDRNGMEWGVRTWSPENPDLYDIVFRLKENGNVIDEVRSYFAMREIRIDSSNVLLNGVPIYQRLILDQGYWKDSHMTPPDEGAIIEDIDKIHALGFNGLRKHQKTEDERFLYWCDVKGMLVWSEMAAAYQFSDDTIEGFTKEWMEIVRQNYNHPCIITWTPFNESWGISKIKTDRNQQNFTEAIYHLTKSFDPNRPVIVNDGWEHTVSDIITLHDYEESGEVLKEKYGIYGKEILESHLAINSAGKTAFADGYEYQGQPILISEYGGIAFDNDDSGWGYGKKVISQEDFIRRYDSITTAIKELPFVCGYCYTQVSDVQQEINGLMDIERNFKVQPEKICEINLRKTKRQGNIHEIKED